MVERERTEQFIEELAAATAALAGVLVKYDFDKPEIALPYRAILRMKMSKNWHQHVAGVHENEITFMGVKIKEL